MQPAELADLLRRAIALREAQDLEAAWVLAQEAVQAAPDDPLATFLLAQIALDTGRPATALFERAAVRNPGHPEVLRNHAAALAAAGDRAAGIALLQDALAQQPEWIDGHRALLAMRTLAGEGDAAFATLAAAARARPASRALWQALLHALIQAKSWDAARAIIAEAQAATRDSAVFVPLALVLESETGASRDPALFAPVAARADPGIDVAHVRHLLRLGRPADAAPLIERHLGTAAQAAFWPYAALVWRLTGDARVRWLEDGMAHVRAIDLAVSAAELRGLAARLRTLHDARAAYAEQSVRGGTQTQGQLLLHHAPEIQAIRQRFATAVRDYAAALPPVDRSHPLLSHRRDAPIRFEGSWSVLLQPGGHHSVHSHVRGWISSAFYVAMPPPADLGPAPAGWLRIGAPPPELELPLPPYGDVEAKPGRLILFPSTLWHGTVPFAAGERLTIAFDVRPPAPPGR